MIKKFSGWLPKTKEFSAFARKTLPDIHPQDGHDQVLLAWMEREEILFQTMEKHITPSLKAPTFSTIQIIFPLVRVIPLSFKWMGLSASPGTKKRPTTVGLSSALNGAKGRIQ
jgi:hypothetical protein